MTQLLSLLNRQTVVVDDEQTGVLGDTGLDLCNLVDFVLLGHELHLLEFFPGTVRHKDVTGACPKRKPPRCMSDGGEKTYLLDHLGWRDVPLSSRAMPVCTGCLWQRIRA